MFLGLSAAAIAALGSGGASAQEGAGAPLAAAVAKLADLLETGYVVPETGKRYAAMLRQKLAAGGYAALTDPEALGRQLTIDLAAVSPDRHLRVTSDSVIRTGSGGPRPAPQPGPRIGPAPRRSVEDAGWVAKQVAYIRFVGFTGEPDAVAATADFMKIHATAKALIVDCRYNGGGGVAEMNAMLPYLYARETVLVQMQMAESVARMRGGTPFDDDKFIRPVANPSAGIISREHYVVPHKTETGLFGAKVFYLTSNRTASAAEHLTLALKRTRRATLIGEITAGANHFGEFERIGGGLAVFLPVGRTIDPDTGKDWEADGIAPDVAVAPALALEEALRRAGVL
ncbi:MAG: S41 family peptidase [Proteobacteria bacterium]|nr:S41 family peptidase [Pseudomonadota bacterium]